MSTKLDIAIQFIELARSATSQQRIGELLKEDAAFMSTAPVVAGREAIIDALFRQDDGLYARLSWDEPVSNGDTVLLTGRAPEGSLKLGYLSILHLKDDKITLIQQQDIRDSRMAGSVRRPPPPDPVVKLPLALKDLINEARSEHPILIAAVDELGQPVLSFRGSIHVYSDDQLALWIRNPEGELINAIKQNPRVSVMYRDHTRKTNFQLRGRARITNDHAERTRVFSGLPITEQNHDFAKVGNAVIVDLDMVEGYFNTDPGWTMLTQRRARQ